MPMESRIRRDGESPSTRREWIEIKPKYSSILLRGSPSTRREWIEIVADCSASPMSPVSPSTRREWIEIAPSACAVRSLWSPSTRREWIEIGQMTPVQVPSVVSLHTEGVD